MEESERLQAQAIEEDRRLKAAAVLRLNAEMHMRAGEYADAIDVWRQAIRMQPRYAPPHLRLAEALVAANRGEDAVEEYRTAIALGAGPDAHRRLAELYGVLGRPADANRARAAHVAVRLEDLRQRADRGVYGFLSCRSSTVRR